MMSLISQNAPQKRHRLQKPGADEEGTVAPEAAKNARPQNDYHKDRKRKKANEELKAQQSKEEAEEMRRLESSLFGAIYAPPAFGTEKEARGKDGGGGPLFFVDRSAAAGDDDRPVYEEDLDSDIDKGRKPAWMDEEEDGTEVDIVRVARLRKLRKEADERVISGREYEARLRAHHAKLNPSTGWADMDRKAAPVHDGGK